MIKNGNKFKTIDDNNNKKEIKKSNKDLNSNLDHQTQTILHTLSLVKQIVHHFQLNTLQSVVECLLRLITLKDIVNILLKNDKIFMYLFIS